MSLDDSFANRQTQPRAITVARVGIGQLIEWLEDAFELIGWDSTALIPHPEDRRFRGMGAREFDVAALRRKLDGIVQKIGDYLENSIAVGDEFGVVGLV